MPDDRTEIVEELARIASALLSPKTFQTDWQSIRTSPASIFVFSMAPRRTFSDMFRDGAARRGAVPPGGISRT